MALPSGHHYTPAEEKGLEQERDDLRATGDLLQSSLSRVLEWIDSLPSPAAALPYEVFMATLEGQSAVDLWTEIRAAAASSRNEKP